MTKGLKLNPEQKAAYDAYERVIDAFAVNIMRLNISPKSNTITNAEMKKEISNTISELRKWQTEAVKKHSTIAPAPKAKIPTSAADAYLDIIQEILMVLPSWHELGNVQVYAPAVAAMLDGLLAHLERRYHAARQLDKEPIGTVSYALACLETEIAYFETTAYDFCAGEYVAQRLRLLCDAIANKTLPQPEPAASPPELRHPRHLEIDPIF